jgi:hypothetical protein
MKSKIDGHSILLPCMFLLAVLSARFALDAYRMQWSGLGICYVAALASLPIFVFEGSRATLVQAEWTEAARSESRRMTER